MYKTALSLLAVLMTSLCPGAIAQDDSATGSIFDQIKIELVDLKEMSRQLTERLSGEPVRMSLDDCIQAGLKANQDILIVSYEPLKSEADIDAARGEFDPVLSSSLNFSDSSLPASPQTAFFGNISSVDQEILDYKLGIGGKLRWGTQYSVDYSTVRERGTFVGDPITMRTNISEYSGSVSVTLTQPLIRGLGSATNRARIRTALTARYVSESTVELTVIDAVGEIVKAYWNLVGAIETLRVREESLNNAERLVEINKQRLRIGTAAAIEVLQAKAGAATRMGDLVSAQTAIANADDRLKDLIGMQDRELYSPKSIIPITRPSVATIEWDLNESIEAALKNRPEVHAAELQTAIAKIELDRARNAKRPQLDLSSSYGRSGRAFDFQESLQDVRDQEGHSFSIGLFGSVPIKNRAAQGAHRRAKLELAQAEQRLDKTRRGTILSVRIALREVATSEILVESTRQARILQEANVAAEEKRLYLGVTTSQNLLDVQEDLTEAQTQEVQVTIGLEKSVVNLQVAEGTLLKKLGIDFESTVPDRLR
ncbi:MAG: TolC family protein [Candidatus Hydrogenedentes bacterium]|nr:TolC family protein [Candidatus Hydrogenedentota bacterium]